MHSFVCSFIRSFILGFIYQGLSPSATVAGTLLHVSIAAESRSWSGGSPLWVSGLGADSFGKTSLGPKVPLGFPGFWLDTWIDPTL